MTWKAQCINYRLPPDLLGDYLWLKKGLEARHDEYVRKTRPVIRLLDLVKRNCVPAKADGWRFLDHVWVWEDSLVFQIERASWDDVPESTDWLCYLRRMYVVDSRRNQGIASRFLNCLQRWALEAETAVSLVSLLFGFSGNGFSKGPYFLESVADLLALWDEGSFHAVYGQEWLCNWYLKRGFQRIKLLDGRFFSFASKVASENQLIYLPSSLSVAAKRSLSHRLTHERRHEPLADAGKILISDQAGAA
jgi:GNAT superfamily N-acetyltransferase